MQRKASRGVAGREGRISRAGTGQGKQVNGMEYDDNWFREFRVVNGRERGRPLLVAKQQTKSKRFSTKKFELTDEVEAQSHIRID